MKKAIEIARSQEASHHQLKEISKDNSVDRVGAKGGKPRPSSTSTNRFPKGKKYNYKSFDKSKNNEKCTRCGKDRHRNLDDCRALKAKCDICGKVGHFKDCCFSKHRHETW